MNNTSQSWKESGLHFRAHADHAPLDSWWAVSERDGFTDRAREEWAARMRFSRMGNSVSGMTVGDLREGFKTGRAA